jgi:hypothetical protein
VNVPNEQSRIWWPFAVVNQDKLSQDEQAKLTFLEEAARQGFRAFVQQSDCGAVAPDGRECYLIWRGRQRSELLLIDHGAVIVKKMFADPSVALAFRQAYAEGLAWLRACPGTSA